MNDGDGVEVEASRGPGAPDGISVVLKPHISESKEEGAFEAELRQVLARGRPPRLRSVAQREEGLGAPRSLASGG